MVSEPERVRYKWRDYKKLSAATRRKMSAAAKARQEREAELERLPVLFRAERSGKFRGDCTALFPTLPGSPGLMVCYHHVGQHSSASLEWYYSTRPATDAERADLLAELNGIYNDCLLVERRRITYHMRKERLRAESAIREGVAP